MKEANLKAASMLTLKDALADLKVDPNLLKDAGLDEIVKGIGAEGFFGDFLKALEEKGIASDAFGFGKNLFSNGVTSKLVFGKLPTVGPLSTGLGVKKLGFGLGGKE